GGNLDVISRRRSHVRVTLDCLDRFVSHTQTILIACEPAPCSVPTTPLRKTRVKHVLIIGGNVRSAFRFATTRAVIEHRLYFAREQVVHVERPAQAVREDRPSLIV